jgi:hypothetical protein
MPIQVETGGDLREPRTFTLAKQTFTIARVLAVWHDYGFGKVAPKRPRWFMRHHRTYYRVQTTNGEVYELYYDRGVSLGNTRFKKWFLTRKLPGFTKDSDHAASHSSTE